MTGRRRAKSAALLLDVTPSAATHATRNDDASLPGTLEKSRPQRATPSRAAPEYGAMRSHDPYVRLLLDRILAGHGEVLQEFPLRPRSTRRADVVFIPGSPRDDAIPLGAMARITVIPAAIEAFSTAPGVREYQQVLSKTLDIRHAAERRRATDAERALRGVVSWMLCSAHPARLLREAGAAPMTDAPMGFYALAAAHPVNIVSLTELVPTNDTLMLRLLAAELSAKTATELRLRARGDPRFASVMRAVLEYLTDLLKVTPGGVAMLDVSTEVKKYVEWLKRSGYRKGVREGIRRGEQRGIQKGMQTGVQQGMQQGMQQGLAPLLRLFSRRLDRALTDDERAVVVARLDSLGADRLGDVVLDLTPPALAAWLADPAAQ
jgi:hypothetical protein